MRYTKKSVRISEWLRLSRTIKELNYSGAKNFKRFWVSKAYFDHKSKLVFFHSCEMEIVKEINKERIKGKYFPLQENGHRKNMRHNDFECGTCWNRKRIRRKRVSIERWRSLFCFFLWMILILNPIVHPFPTFDDTFNGTTKEKITTESMVFSTAYWKCPIKKTKQFFFPFLLRNIRKNIVYRFLQNDEFNTLFLVQLGQL